MAPAASPEPPPFDPAWFDTVFLVPSPPPQWPHRFAVVTAHNPGGRLASPEANLEGARDLERVLRSHGIDGFEVTGASPDLLHREAGLGFETDLATAAVIAARFRQQGFFWIEAGNVSIRVDASGREWPMGSWQERLRG